MSGQAGDQTIQGDYVRVKRKRTTIFVSADMVTDTVHDLRARVNLITKVPTTDIKFFMDESGEAEVGESKTLKDMKVCPLPRWQIRSHVRTLSVLVVVHLLPALAWQIETGMILYMVYKKEGAQARVGLK